MEITLVSIILLLTIALLVTERLPVDVTAIGVMVALMVSGLLSPEEAVAGFSNPAPLTVAVLFIVARGLQRTGALDLLTGRIVRMTEGHPRRLMLISIFAAGGFSAVLNNTPVVVMFIGILIAVCGRTNLPVSKYLMPVSFVSILAGTSTLIGSSTNIVVSDAAVLAGYEPIGMFELSKLAIPLGWVGAAYLYFASWRLLPSKRAPVLESSADQSRRYISELRIHRGSRLIGRTPYEAFQRSFPEVEVFEVVRGMRALGRRGQGWLLEEDDLVLLKASAGDLVEILRSKAAKLPETLVKDGGRPDPMDQQVAELVVLPNSELVGQRLVSTHLGRDPGLHALGVQRRRVRYADQKLDRLNLAVGDVLLVQGDPNVIESYRAMGDLLVVDDVIHRIRNRGRAPLAVAIFAAMVVAAATGVASILYCSLTAAFLMLVTKCVRPKQAYAAVDVSVVLLIVGTLALGTAMKSTGAAELYAHSFLQLWPADSPRIALAGFIVLTSLLSHLMSNNATALLLAPIGIASALELGVDPRPFIIGVCFGAAACYGSPIGYQTNLMVHGPGGYRFRDFLKLGMPLNVIVWVGSALLIPVFWPF